MFKKSYSKKDFEKLAEGMKTAYEQRIRQLEERVDRLNVENKNLRASCAEYVNIYLSFFVLNIGYYEKSVFEMLKTHY